MTPPFKYEFEEGYFYIFDRNGDDVAQTDDEATARLICGLLNGHFGVPVVFHAEPIQLRDGTILELKQV